MDRLTIGKYTLNEYIQLVKDFHGSLAPGLVIGGFMVELAQKHLPKGELFDAICETRTCLPDAVQLLTPCTIGNGWMKILDFSRYALTLYEKTTGEGVRVYMDSAKVSMWSEVNDWFFKKKPKKEQDSELLIDQIIDAGTGLLSLQKVKVKSDWLGKKKQPSQLLNCSVCGESFKSRGEKICPACNGESPYEFIV